MEELHMTWLTWLLFSILAEFQELNTDHLSLHYKLGTLSMEKVSAEEPTSEEKATRIRKASCVSNIVPYRQTVSQTCAL